MPSMQELAKRRKKKAKRQAEAARMRGVRIDKDEIDYKNLGLLQRLVSAQGKLYSRKRTGLTADCQRMVARELKRARIIGLMPFVA